MVLLRSPDSRLMSIYLAPTDEAVQCCTTGGVGATGRVSISTKNIDKVDSVFVKLATFEADDDTSSFHLIDFADNAGAVVRELPTCGGDFHAPDRVAGRVFERDLQAAWDMEAAGAERAAAGGNGGGKGGGGKKKKGKKKKRG